MRVISLLPSILLAALLAIAGCSEVGVDPETANVTRRVADTIVRVDTIEIRHDSIVVVRDTIVATDTVRVIDTVRLDRRMFRLEAVYWVLDGTRRDSYRLQVDTNATTLHLRLDGGRPDTLALQLLARSEERPVGGPFQTPSWLHLLVDSQRVAAGASAQLRGDPTREPEVDGVGILFRRTTVTAPSWLATGGKSEGTFTIVRSDLTAREIIAWAKARFYEPGSAVGAPPVARIDSLALTIRW